MTTVRMFSQRIQWTPLLLVVLIFACENTQCGLRLSSLCMRIWRQKRSTS